MPIIFASALLLFPQQIFGQFNLSTYNLVYGGLVFAFSYFWVSIMFKPLQIADELKRNSGYIPGVRPGEFTAKFLDYVMTRLTFAGACFLVIIAILPNILMSVGNSIEDCIFLWRHRSTYRSWRIARYNETSRNISSPTPLRWFLEEGAYSWS